MVSGCSAVESVVGDCCVPIVLSELYDLHPVDCHLKRDCEEESINVNMTGQPVFTFP